FLFSSRRRHTRSKRDWSSYVCSSDLLRRGLSLIEALLDETSLDLMTNGIEGTHYEVDADGAVTITDRPLWEQEVQPFSGARPSQLYYSRSTDPYVNE